ncbi:MAG: ribosomal protein L11 methyltransferase [Candidatus Promineifilaceae bacterium]
MSAECASVVPDAASFMLRSSDATQEGSTLYRVLLSAPSAAAAELELGFELLEWDMVSWEDIDQGCVRYEAYFSRAEQAQAFAEALKVQLEVWQLAYEMSVHLDELANDDWQERWKSHFDVLTVTNRVVIRPAWLPYEARPGQCVVSLEPGMSFGTGQHFTTHSCLTFIDQLAVNDGRMSFLDIGCGSGILAIAAAKLGFSPVLAVDNDPICVETTRDNAEYNDVADHIRVALNAPGDAPLTGRYDVVVANILANVLIAMAEKITACVREGVDGSLLLSGIMLAQRERVEQAYLVVGFTTLHHLQDDEWCTLLMRRV